MSGALRKFALCADDFGQSQAISEGILELMSSRRLSATSVLSEGPYWKRGSRRLSELQRNADIGLHLNLTHAFEGVSGTHPLIYWLMFSRAGLVSQPKIKQTFLRQIDKFADAMGRLPDYLDGHQHVHAFPSIRDVLMEVIAERWTTDKRPWVRSPECLVDNGGEPLKAMVLRSAARGFHELAASQGLRTSKKFGGLYSLLPDARFAKRMKAWMHLLPSGTLMMCHPGRPTIDLSDPIAEARAQEFAYLGSPRFADDCHETGVRLVRFDQLETA